MISDSFELPPELAADWKRARRLAWGSIGFLLVAATGMALVSASSQAMKTAWVEDVLSMIPPIAFLVGGRLARRAPSEEFPYGHHRTTSLAYLVASVALTVVGALLLFEAGKTLWHREHPTVGSVELGGHSIWLGWLMLPMLIFSGIGPFILGRLKLPLADRLHDKVLHADARMNKADWLTSASALGGVIGIGLGWWWADAAAAAIISIDVLHDGIVHLRMASGDLMDRTPRTVDSRHHDPITRSLKAALESLEWVEAAEVRIREDGHVFFADAEVVPRSDDRLSERVASAAHDLRRLDWRLHELRIMPVPKLRHRLR